MDVRVDGSLLVHADCVTGSLELPGAAAAAQSRSYATDIHVSHPDGRQTLFSAAEPAGAQAAHTADAAAHVQLQLGPVGAKSIQEGPSASSVVPFTRPGNPENHRLVYSDRCAPCRTAQLPAPIRSPTSTSGLTYRIW